MSKKVQMEILDMKTIMPEMKNILRYKTVLQKKRLVNEVKAMSSVCYYYVCLTSEK